MADLTNQHDLPEQARRLLLKAWQHLTAILRALDEAPASGSTVSTSTETSSRLALASQCIVCLLLTWSWLKSARLARRHGRR
jgi:hypothetical protein